MYHWSEEQLKKKKKQIQNLLRYTKGFTKEEIYAFKEEITLLNKMIKDLPSSKLYYTEEKRIRFVDKSHFLPTYVLQEYTSIPTSIQNLIFKSVECFKGFISMKNQNCLLCTYQNQN